MLAARRARGGRAVVLMSPVLPRRLFDLCVIPEHDRPRPAANVLQTLRSLNRVQAVEPGRHDSGLLLVGGSSLPEGWCDLANVHMLGRKPYEEVAAYQAAMAEPMPAPSTQMHHLAVPSETV